MPSVINFNVLHGHEPIFGAVFSAVKHLVFVGVTITPSLTIRCTSFLVKGRCSSGNLFFLSKVGEFGRFAPETIHCITSWEGGSESPKPGETGDPLGRARVFLRNRVILFGSFLDGGMAKNFLSRKATS